MRETALEEPENAVKKQIFIWYYDVYLVACLPKEFWKEDIRYYQLLTDEINIFGKMKGLVTVSSEAFALLMWENCRDKWINYFKYKEANGEKAAIPKGKEPGAQDHLAKWSDGKEGQVLYGGWKEEAYVKFEELKKTLKAWRAADTGKLGPKLALKYMRTLHKRTGKFPEDDKKKGSSRKRKTTGAAPAPKRVVLTFDDE